MCGEGDRDNIVLPEIYQRQQDCFSPRLAFFLCFIPVSISPASSLSIHCFSPSFLPSVLPSFLPPPPAPFPNPLLLHLLLPSFPFHHSRFSSSEHQLHFITSSLAAAHQATAMHWETMDSRANLCAFSIVCVCEHRHVCKKAIFSKWFSASSTPDRERDRYEDAREMGVEREVERRETDETKRREEEERERDERGGGVKRRRADVEEWKWVMECEGIKRDV